MRCELLGPSGLRVEFRRRPGLRCRREGEPSHPGRLRGRGRQLHRHRQQVPRGAVGGDRRQFPRPGRDRWVLATKYTLAMRSGDPNSAGKLAQEHEEIGRGEPATLGHHPALVATLILIDTYAGWKGSLPEEEVRARVAGGRRMLAAPAEEFDPTLPGLFAGDPPAEFVALLEEMAAAVRPQSLRTQLFLMAEADQRDVLPRIAVPTLLIWGELDARSPLSVAHQFEQAIPHTNLVVIAGCGDVSNLEQPEQFNKAVRDFCRAHPPR